MIGDELPQKNDLAAADVAPAVTIFDRHGSSVTEKRLERKPLDANFFEPFSSAHSSPHGRCLCVRIAGDHE
jgi:hypothetical protein